jgi:putative transposase
MNTYKSTRHAKFLLNYHFIWIPKCRKYILDNTEIKQLTLDTINELADTYKFEVLATEIMPDHIHLFISTLPKYSPSKLMNIIKGTTGRRISKHFPELNIKGSIWTRAYFVATAGNVSSETIQHYIENQR